MALRLFLVAGLLAAPLITQAAAPANGTITATTVTPVTWNNNAPGTGADDGGDAGGRECGALDSLDSLCTPANRPSILDEGVLAFAGQDVLHHLAVQWRLDLQPPSSGGQLVRGGEPEAETARRVEVLADCPLGGLPPVVAHRPGTLAGIPGHALERVVTRQVPCARADDHGKLSFLVNLERRAPSVRRDLLSQP